MRTLDTAERDVLRAIANGAHTMVDVIRVLHGRLGVPIIIGGLIEMGYLDVEDFRVSVKPGVTVP
jgi:hypothetical protein